MIILDENLDRKQREALTRKKVAFQQVGRGVGRLGMSDQEVIPLLHGLNRPTFFTLDEDYFERRLCHAGYCLLHLDVDEDEVAGYVRRILKHPDLNTRARRMGLVLSVSPTTLVGWRVNQQAEVRLTWPKRKRR